MGYIGVISHLLTIDPNFQRDIQVVDFSPKTYKTTRKCNQNHKRIHQHTQINNEPWIRGETPINKRTIFRAGLEGRIIFQSLSIVNPQTPQTPKNKDLIQNQKKTTKKQTQKTKNREEKIKTQKKIRKKIK